jgi:hypothetical protein
VLYILLILIIRICFQRFVNFCHSIYLELLLQNPVSTFIILLLILLSNDVELNPTWSTLFIRISIKSRTNIVMVICLSIVIDDLVTWNTWYAISYVFGITQFFFFFFIYAWISCCFSIVTIHVSFDYLFHVCTLLTF